MSNSTIARKQLRDLRVSQGTGLTVGIASGTYMINGNHHYFAGSASVSMTDNTTNYVMLDDSGAVVTNTTGFLSANVPLAEVVTLAGAITSILDSRPFISHGGVFIPAPASSTDNYLVRFDGAFGAVQDADVYVSDGGFMGLGSVATSGTPGQLLHLGDGNLLIEGGGETAFMWKRDITYTGGASGTSANPIFQVGRIIQAGDGDPEIRIIYSDDAAAERVVMELDRKGIIASVKQAVGSHFEGFIAGDSQPYFRLNSYSGPLAGTGMRLEMGPGGATDPDVAVERTAAATMGFYTGATQALRMRLKDAGLEMMTGRELRFLDSADTNYVGFKAPTTISTNEVWTLPDADGTDGQVLKTNGANVLSWVDQAGGAGAAGFQNITSTTYNAGLLEQIISDGTTYNITFDKTRTRIESISDGTNTFTPVYNPDGSLATSTVT